MIIGCLSHCSRTKPEQCPYGHSLAPGMPQKISWMPCICEPAREAIVLSCGSAIPAVDQGTFGAHHRSADRTVEGIRSPSASLRNEAAVQVHIGSCYRFHS